MLAASGVESGFAMWAGIVGGHVILNAQFVAADSTKNGFLIKFGLGPNLMGMVCFLLMTGKAGVIFFAAFEFDRNDIQFRVPMHASGLVVHRFAKDINSSDLRDFQGFQNFFLGMSNSYRKNPKAQQAY